MVRFPEPPVTADWRRSTQLMTERDDLVASLKAASERLLSLRGYL